MPTVLVPLAQGCEELEAITVIDLLRRAGIEVVSAGLDEQVITASRGTRLVADIDLDKALERDYDMVVLPGGLPGAENLEKDHRIQALLRKMAGNEQFTAAICAAPGILARAGLLDGRKATGYPGVLERTGISCIEACDEPVVIDGNMITSRGPGTAMDFALTLIGLLSGQDKRREVETALVRS